MVHGIRHGFLGVSLRGAAAALLLGLSAAGPASPAHAAEAAKAIFGRATLPAVSDPKSIGFYAKGCISGAVALPIDRATWQVMRLERNRRWGHPRMIGLLERLSQDAVQDGWPGLLVGDISQPRGGPMASGHASHQVGLDVDIWLTPMPNRRLSSADRSNMSAGSVLKKNSLEVDPKRFTPQMAGMIRRAASYPEVERIFVHPGIKKAMCQQYGGSRANDVWMRRLRPYWGHDDHIHIRISCQPGSPECKKQEATPAGNGCDKSLDWWFTSEPWTPKKPKPGAKPPKPHVVTLADLPPACRGVVDAPAPTDVSLVTYSPGYDPAAAVPVASLSKRAESRLPAIVPIPATRPN